MYKILDIDNKTHLQFFLCTFKKNHVVLKLKRINNRTKT